MVLAYPENNVQGDIPYLFRSHQSGLSPFNPAMTDHLRTFEKNLGAQDVKLSLATVARATSAAPRYFKPTKVWTGGVNELRFKDGGFGSNNPSLEVYYDIIDHHGGLERNMGPFVSIGTGVSMFTLFSETAGHLCDLKSNIQAALKTPTLTANTHRHMQKQSVRNNREVFPYFRFNGGPKLGSIKLDEWETRKQESNPERRPDKAKATTLEKISNAMKVYLNKREIDMSLRECARLLVQRRRLRARDEAAWERYAVCSYWVCDDEGCTDTGWDKRYPTFPSMEVPRNMKVKRFNLVTEFKDHMCEFHGMVSEGQEIRDKLRECRWCSWVYPRP